MKTFVQTPQINSSTKIENTTCANLLGLYTTVEETLKKCHNIQEIKNNSILDSLKNRTWNYLYVTPKGMDNAIHNWVEFRTMHNISLPISLEDELAIIFYIYICHDTNKQETIKSIFSQIWANEVLPFVKELCWENTTIHYPIEDTF